MYPFFLTFTLLSLLSILTATEIQSYLETRQQKANYSSYITSKNEIQRALVCAHYMEKKSGTSHREEREEEEIKPSTTDLHPEPLQLYLTNPPNNSRLNIALLFEESPHKIAIQSHSLYQLLAKLMRQLYGQHPFFVKIPDAEQRILEGLLAQKEKILTMETPDALSTISFKDPALQTLFYLMLRGSERIEKDSLGTPSLLHFITLDASKLLTPETRKINLLYAPPEILTLIFEESTLLNEVLRLRSEEWQSILYQEKNRLTMKRELGKGRLQRKRELIAAFSALLTQQTALPESHLSLFDLSLGKPGTVLVLRDPDKGIFVREVLLKKRPKNLVEEGP